jgi:hypothetical protein
MDGGGSSGESFDVLKERELFVALFVASKVPLPENPCKVLSVVILGREACKGIELVLNDSTDASFAPFPTTPSSSFH